MPPVSCPTTSFFLRLTVRLLGLHAAVDLGFDPLLQGLVEDLQGLGAGVGADVQVLSESLVPLG